MIKTNPARRFWLIELIANWEGQISSHHLQQFFQLGRQQASKDINQYLRHHPDNLEYCTSAKGYLPTGQLNTRAALANYLLQDMQINIKMLDGNPSVQPLTQANIDDIRPWLFYSNLSPEATCLFAHCWRGRRKR
jgi:hypothetical protein